MGITERPYASVELTVKTGAICKIVESGSLSQAARALCLSPSAVSKALAQLESQLGTTLVKRTTRHFALTEGGAALYERATGILRDADHALHEAIQFRKPAGVLHVSCSVAFGCTQVSRLIRAFTSRHPDIDVALSLDDRMVDLVSEDQDVALRITAREDWEYAGRKLTPIKWLYAASPQYLAHHPPILKPADVSNHACLLYPAMTESHGWQFKKGDHVEMVRGRCRAVSNSSLALAEMALDHCGIVCLPAYVAQRYLDDGGLQAVLPGWMPEPRHALYAMYFKTRYHNPAVRVFIEFLEEVFKDGAPWERLPALLSCQTE